MISFGTDGIRGIVPLQLNEQLAYNYGLAIGGLSKNIIIGRDTRPSGQMLTMAFCVGAITAGANVTDVGECSTPAISYLTKYLCKDFGIVISASHNPVEYNGIKVFNSLGKKLTSLEEEQILAKVKSPNKNYLSLGEYCYKPSLKKCYINFITKDIDLKGITICVDCSNGATKSLATTAFKKVNAKTFFIGKGSGKNINKNVGATCPNKIANFTCSKKADIGVAFDGDGDRIIVSDKFKRIYSGDNILYGLSDGKTKVVGTLYSSSGLKEALNKKGISLVRANVGDKWVMQKMEELGATLGGEQSGHIIVSDYLPTGDGLLVAILLCSLIKQKKKPLKSLLYFNEYPQIIKNISVKNKEIINQKHIIDTVKQINDNGVCRVVLRASGTEPKIRIMAESVKKRSALSAINKLENLILKEDKKCAEL